MSKIFQWYFKDFGDTEGQVLSWISDYLSPEDKLSIQQLISNGVVVVSYNDYNWQLNKL